MSFTYIRGMWRWWLREIASLLPKRDLRKELARRGAAELHMSRQGVRLFRPGLPNRPLEPTHCVYAGKADDQATHPMLKDKHVVLSLDESLCLIRQVTVPPNAASRVREILDLDIGRLTPFSRQEVLSAWYNPTPNGGDQAVVEHVIIRKDIVAEAFSMMRAAGAKPLALVVRRNEEAALPFVLDPDGGVFGQKRRIALCKVLGASAAAAVLSLALLSVASVQRQSQMLEAIGKAAEEAEETALLVRQRLDTIKTASDQLVALQKFRDQQVSMLDIWEELSRILPDGSWLQTLSLKENRLQIEGLASNAEELIPLLEASSMFEDVKFASPVYKNSAESHVRFSIALQIGRKPTVESRG